MRLIREAGLRCTAARLAVLAQLGRSKGPISHADLAILIAPLGFDRATVYRNLVEMAEAGILARIDLGDHVWRFELRGESAGQSKDHPHFLCTECGDISCLPGVEVKIKPARGKKPTIGEVTAILLKGLCSHCA